MAKIDENSRALGRIEQGIDELQKRMSYADTQRREMATKLDVLTEMPTRVTLLESKVAGHDKILQRVAGARAVVNWLWSGIAALITAIATISLERWIGRH